MKYSLISVLGVALLLGNPSEGADNRSSQPNRTASDPIVGLQPGLGSLPLLGRGRTRSISPENPTGEKGQGGRAIPDLTEKQWPTSGRAADDLGQGWKVRPFIRLNAGETKVVMDVDGPAIIQHIWLVVAKQRADGRWNDTLDRGIVIRFSWEGEAAPSIEVPVPEFFAVGHGRIGLVNSVPVVVNPLNALNCYWPMPFRQHARITLTNETAEDIPLLTYQITYAETEVPAAAGTFHAQYRRASTAKENPHVILDGVKGQGRYVGTFLAWTQMTKGWFGEGEVKFYLDGDDKFPTICGTGTEDYFLGSFGFPEVYTTAYAGTVLSAKDRAEPPNLWSLYRWHIQDPINFDHDLRVTIQALGWTPDHSRYLKLSDDIVSVAYWYQAEPHAPYPRLPALAERLREAPRPPAKMAGAHECEALAILDRAPGIAAEIQKFQTPGSGWSGDAHLFVRARKVGDFVEVAVPAKEPGASRIVLHATRAPAYGTLRFTVNGQPVEVILDGYAAKPAPSGPLNLGVHESKDGRFVLRAEVIGTNTASTGAKFLFGLDAVLLEPP